MSIFHTLVIISFLCIVFLFFIFNFLYKKWISCFEEIEKINYFNEKTFKAIQSIKEKVSECGITTENAQRSQTHLEEKFRELERSFQTLKETATQIQLAHKTKKAVLDLMKG